MSAATRRHRGQQAEAEDATDLNLGDDFKNGAAITLSLGEAKALLERVVTGGAGEEDKQLREQLPENPSARFLNVLRSAWLTPCSGQDPQEDTNVPAAVCSFRQYGRRHVRQRVRITA